jgi:ABC-type dipeptide/oligopeptide/nickel transport system permease component
MIRRVRNVYETDNVPDDKETTVAIWFGVFFGLLLQLSLIGIAFIWYYAEFIDRFANYFMPGVVLFFLGLFGFSRIKKMSKP